MDKDAAHWKVDRRETKMDLVTEYNPNPIVVTDCDGTVVAVNLAAKVVFPDIQTQKKSHPILKELPTILNRSSKSSKLSDDREVRVGNHYYKVVYRCFSSENRVFVYCSDVTEQVLTQKLRDDYVLTISHELRTPLSIVKSAIANLKDGLAGPLQIEQNKIVNVVVDHTLRLSRLINKVIDLLYLETGRLAADPRMTSLGTLVTDVVTIFKSAADKRGITVEVTLPDTLSPTYMDPILIKQALAHILENAITYATSEVKINAQVKSNMIEVSIFDNGVGIDATDLSTIFDKFRTFKNPKLRNDNTKGVGLGLPICKEIIELHHGSLWAESVVGKGSVFRFNLPYK